MATNLLVTARPGAGKTTLVRRVAGRLARDGVSVDGFYTEEIREAGRRVGFKVISLDGSEGVLADAGPRVDRASTKSASWSRAPRVGKYRVRVSEFEAVGVAALHRAIDSAAVILVDEIGKMELLSPAFRRAVVVALDSGKPLVGTLGRAPDPLVAEIKKRPDVNLVSLTERNRDELVEPIVRWVKDKVGEIGPHR